MINHIKGSIVKTGENFIVLENNGVGYMIKTSRRSIEHIGNMKDGAVMYTYMRIKEREGEIELYGFSTEEERGMFLHLTSVTGVGAKAGIAILSEISPEKLAMAIISNDQKTLTKVPGIGPKAAQRIILELKDKMKSSDAGIETDDEVYGDVSDNSSEAVSALMVLGYSRREAEWTVAKTDCSAEVEDIIKNALKLLMKQG